MVPLLSNTHQLSAVASAPTARRCSGHRACGGALARAGGVSLHAALLRVRWGEAAFSISSRV